MTPRELLRTRSSHLVVALAVAGLFALPASAAGDSATLSIDAEEGGGFFGYLHSSKHSCELGRTVKLFKVGNHGNKLVGTDEAQPNGPDSQWFVDTSKPGTYFAKVHKTDSCVKVKSQKLEAVS